MTTLDSHSLKSVVESQGLTQSELVKRSGVSRAHLSRLLAGSQSQVRESTLKRLARALGVEPAELSGGDDLEPFRKLVAEEHAELDFRGIGMPRLRKQRIQDVFVEPDVRQEENGSDECYAEGPAGQAFRRPTAQPMPATQCVQTNDRVVILGNPGDGKTTLLRFLAHSYATESGGDRETPLYVRLPELARALEMDPRADPLKLVAAGVPDRGGPNVEASLTSALEDEKRRCIVLLDGLDEVGSQKERGRLIECVQRFIERYPRNRFAIASRVVGFESAPWKRLGFAVFRIRPYGRTQLRTFAESWARILSRAENKPHDAVLDTLSTAIFSNPRVQSLASNPLILTILVLLNEARGGALPRRRVDLYEKVVDVFLDTWEGNKRDTGSFDDAQSINLDAREFRWLLSNLSLAMQKADRTLAPRWWIADRMQEHLQQNLGFLADEAKDATDRILRYLTERTGLIEERGLDLFGFSHRTIQEYFASLGVIDEADASASRDVTRCLRGTFFHPQWSEVVRLVAAQLTPPPAESLLSAILDDPDPVGRFLHRGQLLALRCLSDGTTVANRRLVAGVFDTLKALGRSRWLGITLEAIDVLETFEGTRWQDRAKETLAAILARAKAEVTQDEYECLHSRAYMREVFEEGQSKLPPEFNTQAARQVAVTVEGVTCQATCVNKSLLMKDPQKWHSSVCSLLQDRDQPDSLKLLLVRELGRRVATDRCSRVQVRKILISDGGASLRGACASALAASGRGKHWTKRLLLRLVENDRDDRVRRDCARALRDAAGEDASVRARLMAILDSNEPAAVRTGAARGLAKAAVSEPSVFEALWRCLSDETQPEEVRVACAWALEPQIGKKRAVATTLLSWLDSRPSPKLQRIAAQALAKAMADERVEWDRRAVEKAESILMNLEDPCPCALQALEDLATAREVRRGLRLENLLWESLEPLRERIELAFVFGSTARNRQTEDSDIDLLVIGDATLKDLSGPLPEAEKTLGRRISPAIYTRDSFREKYQAGDPFLLDVVRREKIPVMGPQGDSAQGGLDDELRAMVAERVATSQ